MDDTTKQNLLKAMHLEALAYAKYMLFAERARQNGNAELAQVLEKTAGDELSEHFKVRAELVGLVRSDAENLEDAIQRHSYAIETMYRDFAQQAFSAGDRAVGDRLKEIRRGEMKHHDEFKKVLEKLGQNQLRAW